MKLIKNNKGIATGLAALIGYGAYYYEFPQKAWNTVKDAGIRISNWLNA